MTIDDLKKSLYNLLQERITSPLYSAWLISWIVCNWKIFYITFFISELSPKGNRLDLIVIELGNINNILWYPVISTLIILLILPVFNSLALAIHLLYKKLYNWIDNKIKKNEIITLEQKNRLLESYYKMKQDYDEKLNQRENEANKWKSLYDEFRKDLQNKPIRIESEEYLIEYNINSIYSIESFLFTYSYISYDPNNFYCSIKRVNTNIEKICGTFRIVKSLFGMKDVKFISFESIDLPGNFIRHKNFELILDKVDGNDLFNKDASFEVVKSKIHSGFISFKCITIDATYNYSDYYIILDEKNNLKIEKENINSMYFHHRASFRFINPLSNLIES